MIGPKRRHFVGWWVLAALGLGGCGGEAGDYLKIGALLSTTGSVAEIGVSELDAIALAVEQINAAGGIHGKQLRVVQRDDGLDTARAKRVVESFQEEISPVVIGAIDSHITQDVLDEAGLQLLFISPASNSAELKTKNANFMRTCSSMEAEARVVVERLQNKGFKRVAILHTADRTNYGLALPFFNAWTAAGGEVSKRKEMATGRLDYQNSLSGILTSEPDVIVLDANPIDGAQIVQTYLISFSGERVFWFFSERLQLDSFVTGVGESNFVFAHEGIGQGAPIDDANYKNFLVSFSNKYHANPPLGTFAAQAYDAAYLAALGLAAAPEGDATFLRETLLGHLSGGTVFGPMEFPQAVAAIQRGERIDFTGASSLLDFDAAGFVTPVFDIWQVKNGVIEILDQGLAPSN